MKKIQIICFSFLLLFLCSAISYSSKQEYYGGGDIIAIMAYNKIFSPNGDGLTDEVIFEISLLQDKLKIKNWQLDIIDTNTKKIVDSHSGKKEIPKILKWDGFQNNKAVEGNYKYIFTAVINKKNIKIESDGIIIDNTAPYVSLVSSLDTVLLKDGKFSKDIIFTLSAGDETALDASKSKLQIVSSNNKVIKEWLFHTYKTTPGTIIWDGTDDIYGVASPAGEYKVILTVYDIVDNISKVSSEITVLEQTKGDISEIVVKEEPRGLVVNLSSNILFSSKKSDLKPNSANSLNETIKLLNAYPANKVLIEGYTDATGNKKANLTLSYQRAQSVYSYFVQQGIPAERLQIVGYGQDNPIATNKTPEGRALNRRVSVVILKNEDTQEQESQKEVIQDDDFQLEDSLTQELPQEDSQDNM